MPHFDSVRAYSKFAQSVTTDARYFHTDQAKAFLRSLSESAKDRRLQLPKGKVLWRAQLGHDWSPLFDEKGNKYAEEPGPHPPARMKPVPGRATEGRANPKGIPCLYLSTHSDTALSEVRPWIGMPISVAQFGLIRGVELVACASDKPQDFRYFLSEAPPEERDEYVWLDIDRAYSKPINPTDESADYAPTQIIAEMLKSQGLDGLAYRSAFAGGFNVALFDLDCAQQLNGSLFEATELSFKFREIANPYSIVEHGTEETGGDRPSDAPEGPSSHE